MKTMRVSRALLLVAALSGVLTALSAILTCPKCSYEYEPGQAQCANCGAALSSGGTAETPAPAPVAPPADSSSAGLAEAARQVAQLARQTAENRAPSVAYLLARQAIALASASGEAAIVRDMTLFSREQGDAFRLGSRTCPLCKGKGRRLMVFSNFMGELTEQAAPNLNCPFCEGKGHVNAQMSREKLVGELGLAQRKAGDLLLTLGYQNAGGNWVPAAQTTNLGIRQRAAMRRVTGASCEKCAGFGHTGCEECSGAGRKTCEMKGCIMGKVPCPDCEGKRRVVGKETGRSVQQACRTCRQTGVIDCRACGGRGWINCKECSGREIVACSSCQGKGTASPCSRCGGEGLAECRLCKGAGTIRGEPCRDCHGDKVALCSTCSGYGVRRGSR